MAEPVPVITIDGPGGSGKSTVAALVANRLGWHLLPSGSLYRSVAFVLQKDFVAEVDISSEEVISSLVEVAGSADVSFETKPDGEVSVLIDGHDATVEIQAEATATSASVISPVPELRDALKDIQRSYRQPPGLVAEGRDMGTVIFPDAGLKIFLTASPEERAKRRHNQLKDKGIDVSLPALSREIAERDRRDAVRTVAPLKPSEDAVILDTTELGIEQVVTQIVTRAGETPDKDR